MNNEIKNKIGRSIAGSYYDLQDFRISSKNRIRNIIREKIEDLPASRKEEKKEKDKNVKEYKDDQLLDLWYQLKQENKISKEEYNSALTFWDLTKEVEKLENKYERKLIGFVKEEPIYTTFLKNIKGIGPVLSANLIKEFGYCETYPNVAKIWAHTGNSVNEDGIAPRRKKGKNINYSPRLRTITYLVSDCLMKNNKGFYRSVYNSEKNRLKDKDFEKGELFRKYGKPYTPEDTRLTKSHVHMRAMRKMRKLFLAHYWACAREIQGLDTRPSYAVEKLDHQTEYTWRYAVEKEDTITDIVKSD